MTTSHELAHKLLNLPNRKVMIIDDIGPQDVGSCQEYTVTEDDADNCGCCEDIAGEKVIAIYIY
jgi:hypothetical protein